MFQKYGHHQVSEFLCKEIYDYAFLMIKSPTSANEIPIGTTHILKCNKKLLQNFPYLDPMWKQKVELLDKVTTSNFQQLRAPDAWFKDWNVIRFPKNFNWCCAPRTNFNADWSYLENLRTLILSNCSTTDWSTVRFPPNVIILELSSTKFNSDLSYLHCLQILDLKNVQIDSWENVRFPMSLERLQLKNSNFQGDLSNLINLITLDLSNVLHHDWSVINFPRTLRSLLLCESNFEKNIENLYSLENLDLTGVNHSSTRTGSQWVKTRLPHALKHVRFTNCNFPNKRDYAYAADTG